MTAKTKKKPGKKGFALRVESADGGTLIERNIKEFKTGTDFVSQVLAEKNAAAFLEFCNECARITGGGELSGADLERIKQDLAAASSGG